MKEGLQFLVVDVGDDWRSHQARLHLMLSC